MADVVVAQRMWQRRDTPANWTAENPILAAAEIGVEIDPTVDPELVPVKCKIGNGATRWVDLPYFGGSGSAAIEFRANATHLQWRLVGDPIWIDVVALSVITGPPGPDGDVGAQGIPGPSSSTFPTVTCDGGLADIQVGSSTEMYIPFGFQITQAVLVSKEVGSLQIDIRVRPYADNPPGPTHTICGGTPPTLVGANRMKDSALTGWTKTIPADSCILFVVTSSVGLKTAQLTLVGVRS